VLSPLIQLRAEVAARTPGWRDGAPARRQLTRELLRGLAKDGRLDIQARGNRLLGFVLSWWEPRGWTGGPLQRVLVEVEPDSPPAAEWATDRILELGGSLDGPLDLRVNFEQHMLRHRLAQEGLGVDSVVLVGAPGPALVMLQARWAPPVDLRHLGLDIAPMAPHHVDAVIALRHRVFLDHPEFCWFGAMPGHLARLRRDLQQPGPHERHRVVLDRGRVVGSFSATVRADPCWGRTAGLDMVLHPDIQGRGIARTLYLRMLDWLVDEGVDCFKGGTAQSAVMHLGRAMGRVPFETNHRRSTAFPRAHFDPALGTSEHTRRLAPV
jgi:GNAT superfamily N-acetyltransferase